MTPSVLAKISTPMNLFFSHLPARVEVSASGICRASASISEMACSAVVIELPNGVFITMMPRAVAAGMSTLSTPMPARPITFRFLAFSRIFGGHLGGRADGEAVVIADQLGELFLVLAERGLEIDLDAAILEDLHGGGREGVGDENAGSHGFPYDVRRGRQRSQRSMWGKGSTPRSAANFGSTVMPKYWSIGTPMAVPADMFAKASISACDPPL